MYTADKLQAETAKQNNHDWTLCPLAMKQKITKQLCMRVVVYKLLTALVALELALPEEEIPKHIRSTQNQFEVFKNVNCFMSLHRCQAGTLLFHNSTMQR